MTRRVLISNRADASNTHCSSGSAMQFTYRTPYRALIAASSLNLLFANKQFLNTTGESDPVNSVTVRASVELGDGSLWPVTFGGARERMMAPGETIASDAIAISIAQGALFFVRSRPLVDTLGERWRIGGAALTGGYLGGAAKSGADYTDAMDHTAFRTAGVLPFGPVAILGVPASPGPVTGIILGDSTSYGSGDTGTEHGDLGFLARMLSGAGIPHLRLGAPGLAVPHLLGAGPADRPARTGYHRALIERVRPTHAFLSIGNNDIHGGGATLVGTQANLLRYFDFLADLDLKLVASTVTPRTAGSWTTVEGQTRRPATVNARRRALNDWLRSRPHRAITDVLDVAAIAEEPSDPDLWRVDGGAWTKDGTHMNSLGHSTVARALGRQAAQVAGFVPSSGHPDAAVFTTVAIASTSPRPGAGPSHDGMPNSCS
ncbi:SGNH/GDSL hydrolase family protein [Roseomonas sp. CCTCC AB2023176]|uniref:SGNH/GDSL hydrolase family protein n=1 Tax=Roseomonas sp. CCTCC AB2023176 TaxID=3342640 RepID=UPI0035DFA96F